MDLRIQKTKNSIFSAFIELRAAKPLEKITIRELTQKANISKQTFYLHFKDIYDLSEYLENDAITSLIADIPNPDLSSQIRCRSQTALYRIYHTGTSVQHSFPG